MEKKEKKRKLTLCDGCILVSIITLIASIAHPPITQAMDEKRLSDMVDRLQRIRSEIRLYKADNGLFPGQEQIGDLSVTPDEFVAALKEQQTDRNVPYMEQFPANPYVSDTGAGDSVVCVNDPDARPCGTEPAGWWYNVATGEFYACDSAFHTNY
ncbi:MAG: hypothetical protein ISS71_02175 [Phycisphaerae bacterium]|nr:hypothetical protein [Phycisphaerae bacterium]